MNGTQSNSNTTDQLKVKINQKDNLSSLMKFKLIITVLLSNIAIYLGATLICCKFSDPSPYTLPSKGGLPVRLCQSTSYFLEIAVTWQNMVGIKSPLAKCRVEIGLAGHP